MPDVSCLLQHNIPMFGNFQIEINKMYNGIGLTTARGSGTNGYVSRNLAFVHTTKDKVKYKTEEEIQRLDSISHKKPNLEILDHERKRKLELKCLELREDLEEQG